MCAKAIHFTCLFKVCSALLYSCSTDQDKPTINLNDIRPKAGQNKAIEKQKPQQDTLAYLYKIYANDSAKMQIAQILPDTLLTIHFLDRFSQQHQRYFLTDSSARHFEFQSWDFKDSTQCYEAFYNWLDETTHSKSGAGISSIDLKLQKNSLILIANNQILFVLSDQKIQKDKWIKWYSANQNAALLHFIALKEPRKKTKWLQYSHGKITDYAID